MLLLLSCNFFFRKLFIIFIFFSFHLSFSKKQTQKKKKIAKKIENKQTKNKRIVDFLFYNRLPRLPPFRLVVSDGVGVTSSTKNKSSVRQTNK